MKALSMQKSLVILAFFGLVLCALFAGCTSPTGTGIPTTGTTVPTTPANAPDVGSHGHAHAPPGRDPAR